ncbi:MAG: SUMF1/EgtB/PvdO family nonheme iron enzyme, partial [bacterium]|nr:SUMF1/EgtB/PvdO family nonheme iron enzyme [bacterium]
ILVPVAPVDAVGAERYEIYHDALGQAMLDWRERRVAEEQRAEIARWRRLVAALVVAMVVALVAVGVAWVQSEKAKEKAREADDSAALAEKKEAEAQESADQATAKAEEVATMTQRFETALAEKEEEEARVLELQGKSAEAEKLRADSAEREQRMREILNRGAPLEVGEEEPDLVAAMDSRLQAVVGERDEERTRAERATAERNEERTRAERAEGQLTDALVRIQELQLQIDEWILSETGNAVGMRFRRIRAGTFQMGSPPEELARDYDETLHEVTLTRDFWMAETEVTQGQWKALIGNNPSLFRNCGVDCPVENVNWFEALEFANRLSKREGLGE